MNTRFHAAALAIGFVALAGSVSAQASREDSPSTGALRLGPLRLKPSVALTNLGIDTNVFNDTRDPKQDFTASVGPQLDTWLRLGPARLSSHSRAEFEYFQ